LNAVASRNAGSQPFLPWRRTRRTCSSARSKNACSSPTVNALPDRRAAQAFHRPQVTQPLISHLRGSRPRRRVRVRRECPDRGQPLPDRGERQIAGQLLGPPPVQHRFHHLLLRDAAYDAMPKALRADLHRRFAAWLGEHGSALVELDELLGYHLGQACRYGAELGMPLDRVLRHVADGEPVPMMRLLQAEGFVTGEVAPEEALAYLSALGDPLRVERFHFDRTWTRHQGAQIAHDKAHRRAGRALTLPARYLLVVRVLSGWMNILAQLDCTVAVRGLARQWLPGFAMPTDDSPAAGH